MDSGEDRFTRQVILQSRPHFQEVVFSVVSVPLWFNSNCGL